MSKPPFLSDEDAYNHYCQSCPAREGRHCTAWDYPLHVSSGQYIRCRDCTQELTKEEYSGRDQE